MHSPYSADRRSVTLTHKAGRTCVRLRSYPAALTVSLEFSGQPARKARLCTNVLAASLVKSLACKKYGKRVEDLMHHEEISRYSSTSQDENEDSCVKVAAPQN